MARRLSGGGGVGRGGVRLAGHSGGFRRRRARPPELVCTVPSCHGSNLCDDCRAALDRYGEPERPPAVGDDREMRERICRETGYCPLCATPPGARWIRHRPGHPHREQRPTSAESRAVLAELWRRMGEGGTDGTE